MLASRLRLRHPRRAVPLATFRERYNIGVDVCDRWAAVEPEPPAILECWLRRRVTPLTYGALRDASNRLANALRASAASRAATGSRCCCPQGAAVPIVHVAIYKLGAIALPLAALFGVDATQLPPAGCGREGARDQRGGLGKARGDHGSAARLDVVLSLDGADANAEDFGAALAAASAGLRARRYVRRRSRHDDLHVGHDGPAEGRAACPSGAARPFARRADAA